MSAMHAVGEEPGEYAKGKAGEALEQTKDYVAAARLLETWARSDKQLYGDIAECWLYEICGMLVRGSARRGRAAVWRDGAAAGDQRGDRLRTFAQGILDRFRLPSKEGEERGGMPLGDAHRADLEAAKAWYSVRIGGMANNVKLFETLARGVGKGRVRDVYSEEKIAKIVESIKESSDV